MPIGGLMNKKLLFIVPTLIIVLLITNFFLFASVSINTNLNDISGYIDDKEVSLPYKGFLKTGYHNLNILVDGYIPINEALKIKPGQNKKEIFLKTYKESYIEKTPYVTDDFEIDYNRAGDFFYVLIKNEPYEEIKASVTKELQKNNIDTIKEKIVWDSVAGVNNKVGP